MGKKSSTAEPKPKLPIVLAATGFFLAEVVVLAGAASPFRLPKEAVVLAALSLAVAGGFIAAARRRTITIPRGPLVWILIALPVLQVASALWSASWLRALESSLLTVIWIAGILWLATVTTATRRRLALVAAFGVTISAGVMLLQLAGVSVFDFSAPIEHKRLGLTGLTGNPADLAMAAVLLLPFLLTWVDDSSRPWLYRILAVILALTALITQTLTGVAALAALFAIWLIQSRSKRLWLTTLGLGTLIVAVALTAGLGNRLIKESDRIRKGDWYRLFSARGDGWSAATEMIRERPLVGIGAANYTQLYYPSRLAWLTRNGGTGARAELASHFQWAHCDPLQVVTELGILGIAWMAALALAIMSVWKRAGPLLPLAVAAWAPFSLLHYPTHLAVGLIPIALVLAHLVAAAEPPRSFQWHRARLPIATVVAILAIVATGWQLRRVAVDLWIGGNELRLTMSGDLDPANRARLAAAIEAQILSRIQRLPSAAPTLWRTVGRARLVRREAAGAETAFRTAYALWPHEDAEFFLGMSLVAQGRRGEGLQHLGRVCRTNPALARRISNDDLRRSVHDMVAAYRQP
jgi:O-antigen ligase